MDVDYHLRRGWRLGREDEDEESEEYGITESELDSESRSVSSFGFDSGGSSSGSPTKFSFLSLLYCTKTRREGGRPGLCFRDDGGRNTKK